MLVALLRWSAKTLGTYWDIMSSAFGWIWTIGGGVLTGWAAWAANLFHAYAPFSWVAAGVLGALVFSVVLLIASYVRRLAIQSSLLKLWQSPGDGVNPLDDSFIRKRIKLNDFISPAHLIIEAKTFDRCELIGPVNVFFQGNVQLLMPNFIDCNFVCVKENIMAHQITLVKDCSFLNCKIYRFTIFVTEGSVALFPTVPWLSRTPAEFGNFPASAAPAQSSIEA